ncbi:MAG: helical backbone metal receptor [Planctomycetota bacterium]|nr:helical backbone metal receptor [Planctomycetota bacterium]
MSRVGRTTLILTAGLLLVFLGAVWVRLSSLEGRLYPACLDRVASAPDGAFARVLPAEDGASTLRVDYGDGVILEVPRSPQRIASTLPGVTEMIAYLGAVDRLVAVSPWCDTPESVNALRRVTVQPFDAEGLLAAAPDLVVIDRRLHRRDLALIRSRVPAVLMLETSRSLDHLVYSMEVLAAAVGGEDQAAAFRAERDAVVAAIVADAPPDALGVLVVGQWDPLYALGPGSLLDDLLRICGYRNIACDLGTDASGTFSEELVLARAPAWILRPEQPLPERLAERWKRVPALRDGRLAPAYADDLMRGGPRILGALARLHAVLRGHVPPAVLGAAK